MPRDTSLGRRRAPSDGLYVLAFFVILTVLWDVGAALTGRRGRPRAPVTR
ncbi:hypothetical protein AB0L59_38850 [Streptomyces sp. NPDC052109]